MDMVLPFRLRSAPLLFTAVADAIQWAMQGRGTTWVDHYIDDFVTPWEVQALLNVPKMCQS